MPPAPMVSPAPEGSKPPPLPARAERLARTASALLLALGAASLAVGLLGAFDPSTPTGLTLVFLGGSGVFTVLGGILMLAAMKARKSG